MPAVERRVTHSIIRKGSSGLSVIVFVNDRPDVILLTRRVPVSLSHTATHVYMYTIHIKSSLPVSAAQIEGSESV